MCSALCIFTRSSITKWIYNVIICLYKDFQVLLYRQFVLHLKCANKAMPLLRKNSFSEFTVLNFGIFKWHTSNTFIMLYIKA